LFGGIFSIRRHRKPLSDGRDRISNYLARFRSDTKGDWRIPWRRNHRISWHV